MTSAFIGDVLFYLSKAEGYLREAESRLLMEDTELAKMVKALRDELSKIMDNYVGDVA